MFQAITIKDPHTGFGFRRKERPNHEIQIKAKWQFIFDYIKEFNFRKILLTGDVFDKADESRWSFKQFRLNKEHFEWVKQHADCDSNIGNHDMFFGFESSESTVFGEICKLNYINDISKKVAVYPVDDNHDVHIYGINYSINLDKIKEQLNWFNSYETTGYKIVIMHSNVTPDEHKLADFTYRWLLETYPDIGMFICGHYHVGFPTYTDPNNSNRKIINNWNFNRVVRDYQTEINQHTPEFEHIKISWDSSINNYTVQTDTIKIPCVPYEDAFDSKEIELQKKARSTSFQFFKDRDLSDFSKSKLSDTEFIDKIQETREKNGEENKKPYSKSIVDKAIEYMNLVED